MGKRKQSKRYVNKLEPKRARFSFTTDEFDISREYDEIKQEVKQEPEGCSSTVQVQQRDNVNRKVDLIIRDLENNSHNSLSILGQGLGVEKTIAVVEQLKRNYTRRGLRYTQETSIKYSDNSEPHLQVILTLQAGCSS